MQPTPHRDCNVISTATGRFSSKPVRLRLLTTSRMLYRQTANKGHFPLLGVVATGCAVCICCHIFQPCLKGFHFRSPPLRVAETETESWFLCIFQLPIVWSQLRFCLLLEQGTLFPGGFNQCESGQRTQGCQRTF